MQTTCFYLQRSSLGKLLVLATKQARFPFRGGLCSEVHLRTRGFVCLSSASLRFREGPSTRGDSFGLCLTLLFPCTVTTQELKHVGFTARHPAPRDLGEKLLLRAWSHPKHKSFGDTALDFDLQAHCHGWKVKEGSDSSSPAAESQEGLISYSNPAYICLLGFSSISVMQGT